MVGGTQHMVQLAAMQSDHSWASLVANAQGHSDPAAQLSAAARVEMSVGWGCAEWLSGLPVVFMIPMKDRGSLVHSFSR